MNKQWISIGSKSLALLLVYGFSFLALVISPAPIMAQADPCAGKTGLALSACRDASTSAPTDPCAGKTGLALSACRDMTTSAPTGTPTPPSPFVSADCKAVNIDKNNCKIIGLLVDLIKVLSGLVGIVVVIMIAVGGIQYSAAKDNPQAVTAAKERIKNAIIALLVFIFAFAFLQWLVPGGVL